jgi:hypothetical protein
MVVEKTCLNEEGSVCRRILAVGRKIFERGVNRENRGG